MRVSGSRSHAQAHQLYHAALVAWKEPTLTFEPPQGFSIRIYLPDGAAEGLRIVERSNWSGIGVVCPRSLVTQKVSEYPEYFGRAGVYVLVGSSESGEREQIYVGLADPIGPRLKDHLKAKDKDFWTNAVFFVSKDESLNRAHIQYLESNLHELAVRTKRAQLNNKVVPQAGSLSAPDKDDAGNFMADILTILPLVGVNAFESVPEPPITILSILIPSKDYSARGYESVRGFVVREGSQATSNPAPSLSRSGTAIREDLIGDGVLIKDPANDYYYMFTQDYEFKSSSSAAVVCMGYSTNGREAWKTDDGRTLRQLQESSE